MPVECQSFFVLVVSTSMKMGNENFPKHEFWQSSKEIELRILLEAEIQRRQLRAVDLHVRACPVAARVFEMAAQACPLCCQSARKRCLVLYRLEDCDRSCIQNCCSKNICSEPRNSGPIHSVAPCRRLDVHGIRIVYTYITYIYGVIIR